MNKDETEDLTVEELAAIQGKRTISPYRVMDISVDPLVQRVLDVKRVDEIVRDFDPEALGVLTVSLRNDGTLICLDGQHRAEALKRLGLSMVEWRMVTYEGLTLREEAALFRKLNNTKRLDAATLFRVGVVEEVPRNVQCNIIIERNGFVADPARANGLAAVRTALWLYELDNGTSLDRTLYIARNVWGHRKAAVNQTIMRGFGAAMFAHREAVNLDNAVKKLKTDTRSADPDSMVGQVRATSRITGTSRTNTMAGLFVTIYNRGLKTNKLPKWGISDTSDED